MLYISYFLITFDFVIPYVITYEATYFSFVSVAAALCLCTE